MDKLPKDEITVAIATQPHRKRGLLNVVAELLPQCDRLCICLNGYNEIPPELPRSDKIITILANDKSGIKDLGCNNKMYWAGDFDGYYATVDDDINYPPNYILSLKSKVDKYCRKAICSYHGHIYNNINSGKINFSDRTVHSFQWERDTDILCHRLGMGVAMCCPKEIGLTKSLYLSRPKNFGDDEITAVWAQLKNIPLVRVSNDGVQLIEDRELTLANGLCVNKSSMQARASYLESYIGWKLNKPVFIEKKNDCPFFRIIIPTYNSSNFIQRCIDSILNQTFNRFKIILIDDQSTDNTFEILKKYQSQDSRIKAILSDKRIFAGGCRNIGLKLEKTSDYTLFIDSDDFYTSNNVLYNLYQTIVKNNFPDCINCWFTKINGDIKTVVQTNVNSIDQLNENKCIAPWRKCIKTKLVQPFVEYRRKYNDVIQHLRQCDHIKTIVTMHQSVITYCDDNKLSGWHGYNDIHTKAALYYIIADLLSEEFTNKSSNELKIFLINQYAQMLKAIL